MPMHFIVMDLVGMFKPLPQGHEYTLTVIDVLMNDTWCIPLFTKETDEVVHAYLACILSLMDFVRQWY